MKGIYYQYVQFVKLSLAFTQLSLLKMVLVMMMMMMMVIVMMMMMDRRLRRNGEC